MALLDYVSTPNQSVAYLFPELNATNVNNIHSNEANLNGGFKKGSLSDVFIFQFWPQQVQDSYTPNYSTKTIPGASHPIFQWTGGSGRDISFTANFISEIREDSGVGVLENADFRARISQSSGASVAPTVNGGLAGAGPLGALLLPSVRYTVNVSAALAALQKYLYPTYTSTTTKPPQKLVLVLPGTHLGRVEGNHGILCIMRSASVTMESWFPNGELRSASVSLRFSEIVQRSTGAEEVSQIKYIGAESYNGLAEKYVSQNIGSNELTLG